MPTVTSWGEALMTSVAAALAMLVGGIPKIIAFLVILAIGWMVASAIAAVVARVLSAVKFDELGQRSGFTAFVRRMGLRMDASRFIAEIVKWGIRIVALIVAFDALGLPAVSQVLAQFLAWLPNLVVALAVLVIAGLLAQALSSFVRGAVGQAGIGDPDLLARIAAVAVWAFGIVVAINQIGVATTLVNTLFMGLVGALALAFGLAFGLGGRETAARMLDGWYARRREIGDTAERVREGAERHALSEAARRS